ncbi:sigma-70 family RNA polymerase sigma factor [soil metagenome]
MLADRIRGSDQRTRADDSATSDADLIAGGTSDHFARLYDRYVDGVYRYCRLRIPNTAEAEDATALVFTNAFAAFPPGAGSFRAWLFTIAHNVVVNYYRSQSHRGGNQSLDLAAEIPDRSPTPEETILRSDDDERLYRALAQLPDDQRRVVELRLAGLTGAEIAETLGRSSTAMRQLQFRAMQRLRQILVAPEHPTTKEPRDV